MPAAALGPRSCHAGEGRRVVAGVGHVVAATKRTRKIGRDRLQSCMLSGYKG